MELGRSYSLDLHEVLLISLTMKSWVEKNAIEMYSTHNEGKSVIAERFIRALKNKIYKYVILVSKNELTFLKLHLLNKIRFTINQMITLNSFEKELVIFLLDDRERNSNNDNGLEE